MELTWQCPAVLQCYLQAFTGAHRHEQECISRVLWRRGRGQGGGAGVQLLRGPPRRPVAELACRAPSAHGRACMHANRPQAKPLHVRPQDRAGKGNKGVELGYLKAWGPSKLPPQAPTRRRTKRREARAAGIGILCPPSEAQGVGVQPPIVEHGPCDSS